MSETAAPKKRGRPKKNQQAEAPPAAKTPPPAAKTPPPAQKQFEGDGFPDPPPQEVCDARDDYLQAKRDHANAGKEKAEREEALIEVMHKHGIDRVRLDGENKFFEIEATESVKMKTVPKDARERRGKTEDDESE